MQKILKHREMDENVQFMISVPTTKDPQPQQMQKTEEQQPPLT